MAASPAEDISRLYPKNALAEHRQGDGVIRKLLPDPIPGVVIDRMQIPPSGRIAGVPHMPGTREYLTCESGEILLAVAGEQSNLSPGDVVVFRGHQRHSSLCHSNRRDDVCTMAWRMSMA